MRGEKSILNTLSLLNQSVAVTLKVKFPIPSFVILLLAILIETFLL